MKLRHRKTGEIYEMYSEAVELHGRPQIILFPRGQVQKEKQAYRYNSLAELNEEWEDYKESEDKKVYWIDYDGDVVEDTPMLSELEEDRKMMVIGNCFSSREEAERAVEKLKAWKRLKDSGFRLNNWVYALEGNRENGAIPLEIKTECNAEKTQCKDLDLLFSGHDTDVLTKGAGK